MNQFTRMSLLCFGILGLSPFAPAQQNDPSETAQTEESATLSSRFDDPLARMEGEVVFSGLELHFRNLYALANIQRRYTSRDPNLATRAERLRVEWDRKFGPAADAMMEEGRKRDPAFPETFQNTKETWRIEESAHDPDPTVAKSFVDRVEYTLDGEYYFEPLGPLLAFVPEYRELPHREFDENFWVVPDAFVIERRAVTEDRGGITSKFNGTPHSPWVWVKQPMSWGPVENPHSLATRDANSECGFGRAGIALLAEPLSPLALQGLDDEQELRTLFEDVRTTMHTTDGAIDGPWREQPLQLETRGSRVWCSFPLILEKVDTPEYKRCVAITIHATVADGWLLHIATRYARIFPVDQEITAADAAALIEERALYEPLFRRIVESAEIQTYTEAQQQQSQVEQSPE